jgi:hypothetical protein
MCAPTINSTSQALVPYIRSDLTTQPGATDLKVHKISLEILSRPSVEEGGKLVCYRQYRDTRETTFFTSSAFNQESYAAQTAELLKKVIQKLRSEGSYAELSCKLVVEGTQERAEGTPQLVSTTITKTVKGSLRGDGFERALLGPQVAAIQDHPAAAETLD